MFEQVVEVGESGRSRKRVAAESRDGIGRERVHQFGRGDDPGESHSVPETFRKSDHVGNDPVGLIAPEVLAGPSPSGLDFVGDEEDPLLRRALL